MEQHKIKYNQIKYKINKKLIKYNKRTNGREK